MGYKIFVSYKYADGSVQKLPDVKGETTVRNYVDLLETNFDSKTDNIYKGESDGEDLSKYSQEEIWEKLKDRIFDSSITIVIISPGMRESGRKDDSQWIPWEVAYSLRETTRNDRTSHTNAMIAVVLPDSSGSYEYYLESLNCCESGCRCEHTDRLFAILRRNMFNQKKADKKECKRGDTVFKGEFSYIKAIKWSDFISSRANMNAYLDGAVKRQDNVDQYEIVKEV
ncbi:MAG: TIR domain-containing protein [Clostridia bacterium]|nr:TIR domain-containing protein [Clostridia bacterium]